MTAQLSLDLSSRATRKRIGPKLASRLIAFLSANGCWMNRGQIFDCQILNLNPNKTPGISRETSNRLCRLARESAHGRVIQGGKGYRTMKTASKEEIQKSLNRWESQIKAEQKQFSEMVRRAKIDGRI